MTLSQIEAAANRGGIANGGFNIKHVLRFEVIPEFYRKVGPDATWLRKSGILNITSAARQYDLPDDFFKLESMGYQVSYIGDDPELVQEAEAITAAETGEPDGYYFVRRTSDNTLRAIKFNRWPDQPYTAHYVYRSRLYFVNDVDDLELDEYILPDYQSALIKLLRAEILYDRFGAGDSRGARDEAKGLEIIEELKFGGSDQARKSHAVYSW